MDADDLDPKRPTLEPLELEAMSIEALTDYIAQLEAEINRVKAAIAKKKGARAAADSVFRS